MNAQEIQQKYGILGTSTAIQEILQVLQQVAPTELTILITGESGTGKEVIAKAIHKASKRATQPMLTVNCGAIPEGIIESELFGHEKGAFTGAGEFRKGYFELADGGTIFLDEIGELPLATQVKFLRVLESGEFMRVGSSVTRKVDVRIIAATNRNLDEEVHHKRFRQDLFYRLRSVNIVLPPLRERREDVPILFHHFAKESAEKNKITFLGIDDDAMEILKNHYWQGNIRELRNLVESMLIVEAGKRIDGETIKRYLRRFHFSEEHRPLPMMLPRENEPKNEMDERRLLYRALIEMKTDLVEIKNLLRKAIHHSTIEDVIEKNENIPQENNKEKEVELIPLEEMERKMIIDALKKFEGNRRAVADTLKISERTLYRKIKEYGL